MEKVRFYAGWIVMRLRGMDCYDSTQYISMRFLASRSLQSIKPLFIFGTIFLQPEHLLS